MWPKALAQLLELLPHLTRLLPLADRFLQSKTVDQEANTRAMQAMAEGLRGDLGQVTASHAGLYRQLNEQSVKLSELTSDMHATNVALDTTSRRIARLEDELSLVTKLAVGLCFGLFVAIVMIVILLVRH